MQVPVRVLCVDDSEDLLHVMTVAIGAQPDLELAGVLRSADGLIEALAGMRPDVVLLDLTMPGRDPLGAMREASEQHPRARTIVLSGYDDPWRIKLAADYGAWGYIAKDAPFDRLFDAIRAVARGEVVFP